MNIGGLSFLRQTQLAHRVGYTSCFHEASPLPSPPLPSPPDGVVSLADKHMVSVNWLLNDEPLSVKHSLAIELMDDLLVGTSAATLRKALTDSGLGESVIGGGLSSELLQNTFSIGLKVGEGGIRHQRLLCLLLFF